MLDTTFSRLVGGIYDAVVEPALWTDAVDAIRREFDFHIAMLVLIKVPSGHGLVNVSCNVPEPFLSNAGEYSKDAIDLWGGTAGVARQPLEEPILHSPLYPPDWRENRFYREWGKPQGLVDQVVAVLANDRTSLATLGLGIHESRAPMSAETMDDLRLLIPHLSRAVKVSRLLDMTTNAAATFEAALSTMSGGAILVEGDMKIVYANPTAQAMLASGDAIRSSAGRLQLQTVLVPEQLELAVRTAAGRETQMGRRGIGIPTRRSDGTPLVVHVLPLEQRSPRTGAPWKSVAAVFIADTGGQTAVPDALSVLFQLTPMERRVLELTVAGHSSRDVATALDVAPSTVKTHMLNLFEKTGRHRREDLIKLANEVSLPG